MPDKSIHTGNVEGVGIVIGHDSSVYVGPHVVNDQAGVLVALDNFIQLLDAAVSAVPDGEEVRESALAAKAELATTSPRWHFVRSLLAGIAASVAGIAPLTDIIVNIQAMIPRM